MLGSDNLIKLLKINSSDQGKNKLKSQAILFHEGSKLVLSLAVPVHVT